MERGQTRVTMGDIARLAGVASSTVSRALRDDPTIPLERCAQIKELAAKLGYRPNPLVSTLMAQIHHRRRRDDPDRIAWIDLWPPGALPPSVSMLEEILRGAQQRGESLGYGIEVHHVGAVSRHGARLRQILLARGQWGFIIPPVPEDAKRLTLDMRGLAGVTIGTSLLEPSLHRVTTNHFHSGQLAYNMLQARGFRRIGLALTLSMNERVHGQWLGGYLSAHYTIDPAPALPPLLVEETGRKRFVEWFLEYKPDALLLGESLIAEWVAGCADPDHPSPALGWLALTGHRPGVWGLDYQAERIGAAAVDMVVAQIHRNETGAPAFPHTLMLDSTWTEG